MKSETLRRLKSTKWAELIARCLMLAVPAFMLSVSWPHLYLIVDRRNGPLEALRNSRSVAAGNIGKSFQMIFYRFLVGVKVHYGLPLMSLIYAVAYLKMTRQPIAKV